MESTAKVVSQVALSRFVIRSTNASAQLERRTIPVGYVRTEAVTKFLEHLDRTRRPG